MASHYRWVWLDVVLIDYTFLYILIISFRGSNFWQKIPCQMYEIHSKTFLTVNRGLETFCTGSPRTFSLDVIISDPLFIASTVRYRNWSILLRFSSDSQIKIWLQRFLVLTCVAPIYRASFYNQPYLNDTKRFFVQCLAS